MKLEPHDFLQSLSAILDCSMMSIKKVEFKQEEMEVTFYENGCIYVYSVSEKGEKVLLKSGDI